MVANDSSNEVAESGPASETSSASTERLGISEPGPRRIVICCDGTSNKPNVENPTNVVKIARGVSPVANDGYSQVVFYDWGVGSKGALDGVTGGAFGWGLQKNVEDAYRFIVHNYRPYDEIYLFGFSRGAFTARSVVGLIRQCGIVKKEHAKRIAEGYDNYREPGIGVNDQYSKIWRQEYSHPMPIVEFIGVWDTVGAMGVPANRFKGAAKHWFWDKSLRRPFARLFGKKTAAGPRPVREKKKGSKRGKGRHGFHDMELSSIVRNAYQALAIDERRPVFTPAIWDSEPKDLPDGSGKKQVLQQAWFSGAHSDVGGNVNVANSSITLKWVAEAAGKSGLEFESDFWQDIDKDLGRQWRISSSPSGFWKAAGSQKRDMSGNNYGTEFIHQSVIDRLDDPTAEYKIDNPGFEKLMKT